MDAKNRQKKVVKNSKDEDKRTSNKMTTSPIEKGEITLHTSEEDMSIIVADKNEENQPILTLIRMGFLVDL